MEPTSSDRHNGKHQEVRHRQPRGLRLLSNGRSKGAGDSRDQSRNAGLAQQYMSKIKNAWTWKESLALLNGMQGKGIEPNAYHFSSAISVCEKGSHWKNARELLQEMDTQGIQPKVFCYNAAISACE
jgi:pentatricopeptide repeat protein